MAVFHSPETPTAKELWKWDHSVGESNPIDPAIKGVRPIGFQEYPKAMYRAARSASGPPVIVEQINADDDTMERNLLSRGFGIGHAGAFAVFHDAQREIATAAANRAFTDRRLSDAAQAEAADADAETDEHVPVIPEKPRRGRPRKALTE